ncbi:MAG: hypothetical protein ACHQSE_12220 [Gemmatimonadales bacterium]
MTRSLKIAGVLALALCAGALPAQQGKQAPGTKPPPPLAPMASQHVLVLPVQLLRADSGAWVNGHDWEKFRHELDDSIASIFAARGLGRAWKYAPDVARIAKRNPDYVNDPYSMGVQAMRAVLYKIGDPLPDPFVSNLRTVIALGDARYALVPIEVWFVRKGTEQIAVMKLGLADGQAGTIVWLGEIGSDPETGPTLPPDLINTLATRIANLVVAP